MIQKICDRVSKKHLELYSAFLHMELFIVFDKSNITNIIEKTKQKKKHYFLLCISATTPSTVASWCSVLHGQTLWFSIVNVFLIDFYCLCLCEMIFSSFIFGLRVSGGFLVFSVQSQGVYPSFSTECLSERPPTPGKDFLCFMHSDRIVFLQTWMWISPLCRCTDLMTVKKKKKKTPWKRKPHFC